MRAARLLACPARLRPEPGTGALTAGSCRTSSGAAGAAGNACAKLPSQYKPTGRPPGRPAKPAVEKAGIQDVRAVFANTTVDPRSVPLISICLDCYPDGWPDG